MMRTPRFLATGGFAVACLLGSTLASAADPAGQPAAGASQRAQQRQQMLAAIDTNHDGRISRAEYQAWLDARFAKLDSNGDGVVTADEIAQSPAARQRAQRRAERFIKRHAQPGSDQVSRADFEASQLQRFDKLANGADSVATDALLPMHRGAGKGRRQGPADPAQ